MLSKEAREDLKKDCSFEEIQKIEKSIRKISKGKTVSKEQVKEYMDSEIFSKYTMNV